MNKPALLLIEDAPMMCKFLALFLADRYQVTVCANPTAALDQIAAGYVPDIVVTDLVLPEMSGRTLVKTLRHLFPQLPIMVVSGVKDSNKQLRVLESGADDFMPKPFHPAELKVRLQKLMDRKPAGRVSGEDYFLTAMDGSGMSLRNNLN
ncbi:MAG: response regulator transcription factor [Bacteroidetes bacterium]|nr:response regulator transcription factor [Bacteroidota bacterium]